MGTGTMSIANHGTRQLYMAATALRRASAESGIARSAATLSGMGMGRRDGGEDSFLSLVTGTSLGFQQMCAATPNANQLATKCANTPQLAVHLSQMLQEPAPAPVLDSIRFTVFDEEPSIKWPRRGGL